MVKLARRRNKCFCVRCAIGYTKAVSYWLVTRASVLELNAPWMFLQRTWHFKVLLKVTAFADGDAVFYSAV